MIKEIGKDDLKAAVELVNQVFAEFVAVNYSEEGKKTFYDYVEHKYEELLEEMGSGQKQFWGYYEDNIPVGVIAVRMMETETESHPHIALLFVKKEHQRKGIAKQLFTIVKEKYLISTASGEDQGRYREMSVNSSAYAVDVYRAFGFSEAGPLQELNGIQFVPMHLEVCIEK